MRFSKQNHSRIPMPGQPGTCRLQVRDLGGGEGFVNMPLSIADVRMSIFLTQEDETLRVSIRSKRGTSANRCAATYFNGGGHELAAGGKLIIGKDLDSISDAEEYILKVTGEFFGI